MKWHCRWRCDPLFQVKQPLCVCVCEFKSVFFIIHVLTESKVSLWFILIPTANNTLRIIQYHLKNGSIWARSAAFECVCERDCMECVLMVVYWALSATLGWDPVFMTNALMYNNLNLCSRYKKRVIINVFILKKHNIFKEHGVHKVLLYIIAWIIWLFLVNYLFFVIYCTISVFLLIYLFCRDMGLFAYSRTRGSHAERFSNFFEIWKRVWVSMFTPRDSEFFLFNFFFL